jgi:carboxylate-amine ligase
MLIQENNWRAQRYGVDQSLIDFGKASLVPMSDLAAELIDIVRAESTEIGAMGHLERIRTIVAEGTSADRQRAVYTAAIANGADPTDAMKSVVDHLIAETVEGV